MNCLLGAVQGLLQAEKAVQDSLLNFKCSRRNTPSSCFAKLLVCFREWGKTRYNHRKIKSVHDANSSLPLMADKPSAADLIPAVPGSGRGWEQTVLG